MRRAKERALSDLLTVLKRREPGFADVRQRIELRALQRLTEDHGLLLHRTSLERYSREVMDAIQRQVVSGTLQGKTFRDIRIGIAKAGEGTVAAARTRAELITRMEMSRAYNAGHQASLEGAAEVLDDPDDDDPLLRRIDELHDARNHPLSRAADGAVAKVKEPWRVLVSEVEAAARAMGKPVGRVFWPVKVVGGRRVYEGSELPAHFGDRARIVPHRASWVEDDEKRGTRKDIRAEAGKERPGGKADTATSPASATLPPSGESQGAIGRNQGAPLPTELPALAMSSGGGDGRSPSSPSPPGRREQEEPTKPSMPPAPDRMPRGQPRALRPSDKAPENKRAVELENQAAIVLAQQGYDVEQLRESRHGRGGLKSPDYRVEGRTFDAIAPAAGTSARSVASRARRKVVDRQVDRVVVNLEDSDLTVEELREQFRQWPVPGLKEVLYVRNGQVGVIV